MKIRSTALGLTVLVVLFGGIAMSSALNLWNTANTKVPARITSGEFSGAYNPGDIRGSYSFADISKSFKVPLEDLAAAFGVEKSKAAAFKCKDLESLYGELAASGKEIGTDSVRYFVALYVQIPYKPGENTSLPKAAVDILKAKGVLSLEEMSSLENRSVDVINK